MNSELEKFLKDSVPIQELDNFLKDNGVDSTNRNTIIKSVTGGYTTDVVIDHCISWRDTNKSYYFWYFLQLKWLLTLIRKANDISLKKYLFLKYKGYIRYTEHTYKQCNAFSDDGALEYNEQEFYIAYSKYKRIKERYEEYFYSRQI